MEAYHERNIKKDIYRNRGVSRDYRRRHNPSDGRGCERRPLGRWRSLAWRARWLGLGRIWCRCWDRIAARRCRRIPLLRWLLWLRPRLRLLRRPRCLWLWVCGFRLRWLHRQASVGVRWPWSPRVEARASLLLINNDLSAQREAAGDIPTASLRIHTATEIPHLSFDSCCDWPTGVHMPAPRALEGTLIVGFALSDVNAPHRHPALRAERAPIRHLKCRAAVALQRHASPPTGSGKSAPPLASDALNETEAAAPAVVTAI